MPRRYTPADAGRLLSAPKLIAFACDVTRNEAFRKADARTEDAHGKRVVDYVRTPAEREVWPNRIAELLRLPPADFERAMATEPVRLSPIKKSEGRKRIVGVPTFTRRCISNLIAMILSQTGDHLLPKSARAYRPGSEESVKHALLDVAGAVRSGRVRYWAKLDFSSYFSVMPWWAIEAALRHYCYEEDFIAVVMAMVQCPLVKKKKAKKRKYWRTVRIPNTKGAQMGLAESAALANMVPFELDQWFAERAKHLVYLRYSDDLFIGAAKKSDVVGAVRAVRHWCKEHEIQLKSVSPDTNAENLVKDVKNTRIELLGAEIDQNGEVRLPVEKLKAKLVEIKHRHENAVHGGLVEGVSRYGNGGGTHLFDLDDVEDTVEGFLSYWEGLDPGGADKARALIKKTFPMPVSPRSGGQGVVWIAQLWRVQAGDGVEAMIPAVLEPKEPTEAGPLALTGGGAGLDLSRRTTGWDENSGGSSGLEPTLEVEDTVEAGLLYTEAAADLFTQVEEVHSDEGCSSYEVGEDALLPYADGRKTHRFYIPSRDQEIGSDLEMDLEIDLLEKDLSEINGAEDDPREEPPLPAVLENRTVLYLAAERVRGPGGPRCAVGVALGRGGVLIGRPSVSVFPGRPASALVQAMLEHLSSAAGEIIFVISQTRIVKALLQRHRRVGAPIMFGLLIDLHARAGRRGSPVSIVGGVEPPFALRRAIRDAVEAAPALQSGIALHRDVLAPSPMGRHHRPRRRRPGPPPLAGREPG